MDGKTTTDNQLAKRTIIWERTKRPLIFVSICLAAALALNELYDFKTKYESPFVIVDNKDERNSPYTKPIDAKRLEKLIIPDENNSEAEKINNTAEKQNKISKSISEIRFQHFKKDDDLIKSLTDTLVKNRDGELKDNQSRSEDAQKVLNDLTDKFKKADGLLDERTKDIANETDPLYISYLKLESSETPKKDDKSTETENLEIKSSTAYLNRAFKAKLQNLKKQYSKLDLKDAVKNYFEDERKITDINITRYDTESKKIKDNYEALIKKTYLTKGKLNDTLFKENVKENASETPASQEKTKDNPATTDELLKKEKNELTYLFFDEKGSLNVLYKLIEVTLTVILVFGLLYIIIIPLKYIFFLSTSADILADKAKSYLDRKESPVSFSGLGSAFLLTGGTIAIGAAVVANAELPSLAANKKPDIENAVTKLENPNRSTDRNKPPFSEPDPEANSQLTINRLEGEIRTLNGTVGDLTNKVGGLDIPKLETIEDEIIKINNNLGNINTTIGTQEFANLPPNKVDENNIFKKMIVMTDAFNNREGVVSQELKLLNASIEDKSNPNKETLFKKVEDVKGILQTPKPDNPFFAKISDITNTLGTTEFKALQQAQTSDQDVPKNIFLALNRINNDLGETTNRQSYAPNSKITLFGRMNDLFDSIGSERYLTSKSTIFTTLGADDPAIQRPDTIYTFTRSASRNSQNVNDVGRYLVKDSGNIGTFFKRIFDGKQHALNPFVVTQFQNKTDELTGSQKDNFQQLIQVIDDLMKKPENRNKTFSKENLFAKLKEGLIGKGVSDKEAESLLKLHCIDIMYFTQVDSY